MGGPSLDERIHFDRPLNPHGYQWWYVDVISEDQSFALSIIIFVGHVFSPFYFKARQKDLKRSADQKIKANLGRQANRERQADRETLNGLPENFCAFNISLHALNKTAKKALGCPSIWVLNEYCTQQVKEHSDLIQRESNKFTINQSVWQQNHDELIIDINERTKPFFQRMPKTLCGQIRIKLPKRFNHELKLDKAAKHSWMAIAPSAVATVHLFEPKLSFSGHAYHDTNWGQEPLESAFKSWTWSRTELSQGTCVLYDIAEHEETSNPKALFFGHDGQVKDIAQNFTPALLPNGIWKVKRPNRADSPEVLSLQHTLLDSPFYTRDLVNTELLGEKALSMYESLDLIRFKQSWVRFLLPFRIRRHR